MDIWNDKIITSIDFINSPELHNNRSFYQLINNAVASGFQLTQSKIIEKIEEPLTELRRRIKNQIFEITPTMTVEDARESDNWNPILRKWVIVINNVLESLKLSLSEKDKTNITTLSSRLSADSLSENNGRKKEVNP